MAATATDIWEFRATAGSANAGGGYDSSAGTTDYSNQDSAQLQLTDLATSGIGVTTLTSVTGGFTAAMVGNYIQIRSGTNVTAGFYRVTVRTDTNTVTLDRSPDDGVGGISSGSGDLGGALDIITDAFLDDAVIVIAGNTIHIKNDGTMTLSGAVNVAKDGTLLDYITIDGYNSTRSDNPVGANRPAIAAAGNAFSFDNLWQIKNLIVTATSSSGLRADIGAKIINCKVTNSSGSANRAAATVNAGSTGGLVSLCELISTNGRGVVVGAHSVVIGCYIHDSTAGILTGGSDRATVYGCIIDTCTTGISTTAGADNHRILQNTFYANTTAMDVAATCDGWVICNNIFDANTDGVKWGDSDDSLYMDFNCWDNSTDVSGGIVKGDNSVTGDPGLTDPANGDFTLGSGSNCLDAGLQVGVDQGATGDYKVNIGADQDDVAAAAGGTPFIIGG